LSGIKATKAKMRQLIVIFFMFSLTSIQVSGKGEIEPIQMIANSSEDSLLTYARSEFTNDTLRINAFISYINDLKQTSSSINVDEKRKEMIAKTFHFASNNNLMNYFLRRVEEEGISERNKYKFNNAIFWHSTQLFYADSLQRISDKILALNNLGLLYRRMDKYQIAIESYQEALRLADSTGNIKGYVYASNGLGNIYLALNNFSEAMQNFRECLRIEQLNNNMIGVAINLNNVGHVYKHLNDIDRALEYFMLSLEINREIGSKRGLAICYTDIGDIFLEKKEPEKALNYYLLSYQLNESIEDFYYLAINNFKLAKIYSQKNSDLTALPYVKEAIRLSELTLNRSNLADAYKLMYQIRKRLGNTKDAIQYLELSSSLNDSILNENTQRIIFQMQAVFNREKAQNQIEILKNENQIADLRFKRQKIYNLVIISGFIILVVGIVVLFLVLQFRSNANKLLREKNQEIEQAKNKLAEYAEKLLLAKQDAEQSNRLKSQFLANMSHEIRTPMNSVIGFSDILSKMIHNPQQLGYLESIRTSGQSLLVLINDILDLSKIESGKQVIEFHSMDLRALVFELKRVFVLQSSQKMIDFEIDIEDSLPEIIHSSEISMRQIMFNLIGNAIKFTSKGKIYISIKALPIDEDHCDILLEVQDTGIGMAQEDMEHIFDAFYQSDIGKVRYAGTGLGLTITKRLVEALNGEISVESSVNEGTKFSVIFRTVKFHQQRTRLRIMTGKTNHLVTLSEIGLISNSTPLQVLMGRTLTELSIKCDVYETVDLYNEFIGGKAYYCVLWDSNMINSIDLTLSQKQEVKSESKQILLIHHKSESTLKTQNYFDFVVELPDEMIRLQQIIFENVIEDSGSIQLDYESKVRSADYIEKYDELIMYFEKAEKSSFIQDTSLFATVLNQFAIQNHNAALKDLGIKLTDYIDAFDVEKISECLKTFRHYLKQVDAKS
jgi:signal transduction histidine kinase